MAAVLTPRESAEQRVILRNVSWQTYARLLSEQQDSSGIRLNYDRGALEIMILSLKHERLKHVIATLVELIAAQLGIDIEGAGSTTFQREDLARGFEPDACFYIQQAERVRNQEQIDLTVDPPPDLVIEIDITRPSLNKLPIFAGLGVPEVWRYDGQQLSILRLSETTYSVQEHSGCLPGVTARLVSELLAASQKLKRAQWLQRVQEAVKKS